MTEEIDVHPLRWIEVAEMLARDPKAAVACPKCGQKTLQLIDARVDPVRLDRYVQCTACHASVVLSRMIEPAQTIKLFVLSDRQLSSVTEWQVAIDGEGYPLRLDGNKPIEALGGFLPARLRDIVTGFECTPRPADAFMREMPRVNFDHAWKHVLALQWAGNWSEIPAIWMAAAAYAKATDGVVFDETSRLIHSAAKAQGIVEWIERDMPTLESLQRNNQKS